MASSSPASPSTEHLTDDELEYELARVLKSQNGMFTASGLKPDDDVVCLHTARYIVALLNQGKEVISRK